MPPQLFEQVLERERGLRTRVRRLHRSTLSRRASVCRGRPCSWLEPSS
jgi:hypothetical protein